ncbi:MAG: peptide chain release factor N(5)-glutamine methyltransferase [Oscillospiraceae bacterium]|nr:peptide chain release factor N(5)-glutamine methyltransferase [Oscillospiraceae bacterium]
METYNDVYLRIRKSLKSAGITSPELEARMIISSASGKTKEEVLAMSKIYATDAKIKAKIEDSLSRRLKGEPLAYILEEWEFYGLPIIVSPDVLIPRMDTELLAEKAIAILNAKPWQTRTLDLCAGSGCIGIAIAAKVASSRVVLADVSEEALGICRQNMLKNNQSRNITPITADALKSPPSLLGAFDLIVSNPPYIPTKDIETLENSVKDYEPLSALDGGEEGLEFLKAIAGKWSKILKPGGHMALECGIGQAAAVRYIMKQGGLSDIKTYKDTGGVERVLTGKAT